MTQYLENMILAEKIGECLENFAENMFDYQDKPEADELRAVKSIVVDVLTIVGQAIRIGAANARHDSE